MPSSSLIETVPAHSIVNSSGEESHNNSNNLCFLLASSSCSFEENNLSSAATTLFANMGGVASSNNKPELHAAAGAATAESNGAVKCINSSDAAGITTVYKSPFSSDSNHHNSSELDDKQQQQQHKEQQEQQVSPKVKSPPSSMSALATAALTKKSTDRETTPAESATLVEVEHEAVIFTKTKLPSSSEVVAAPSAASAIGKISRSERKSSKNDEVEADLVALIDLCRSKHDEFDATMTTINGDTSPPSTLEQLERLHEQQREFCERELDPAIRSRVNTTISQANNVLNMANGNAKHDDEKESSLRMRLQQLQEAWQSLDENTAHEMRTTHEAVQSLRTLWKDIGDSVSRIRAMDEERSKKWEPVEDVMINDLPKKLDELRIYRERLDAQGARMDELKQHEALVDRSSKSSGSRHRRRRHIAPAIAEEFLLELNNADSFLKELMQAAADRLALLEEAQQQLLQQQQQTVISTAAETCADQNGTVNGGEDRKKYLDAEKQQKLLASSVSPPYERCIAAANNNVPYYINHDTHTTQWDHPKFAELHQLLEDISQGVKYAAYRVAMRLRAIQKKLYLDLLTLEIANEAFHEHLSSTNNIDAELDCDTMSKCLLQMYEKMAGAHPNVVNVVLGVDLCLNFVLSVCDPERVGFVKEMSFKTLVVLLCNGAVQNKYRCVFRLIVDTRGRADYERFARFMRECIQLPRYLGELNAFGGEDVESSVRSCFATVEGKEINTSQLLKWIGQEPQSLVWLTVLHRIILAENTRHSVRCSVCHTFPIVGLRYRSLIKFNLDLCQACFLSGRYLKKHKEYHPMQEYCLPTTSGEAFRDLRRIVGNKFKGKGYFRRHPRRGYLPVGSSTNTPVKQQGNTDNDDSIATTSVSATTSAVHTPARGSHAYHSMRAQSTPPRGPPPLTADQSSSASAGGGGASRSGTLNTTKNADDALDAATYGARIVNNNENDLSTSSSPPSMSAQTTVGSKTKRTVPPATNFAAENEKDMMLSAAAGERDEHQLIKRYCDVLKQSFVDGGGGGDDINDVAVLHRALLSGPDSVMQTAERGVRYESHDYLRQLQQDHDRLLQEFEHLHYGQQQLQMVSGSGGGLMEMNLAQFSPFEEQQQQHQFLMQQQQNNEYAANTAASDVLTTERRALQIEKTRMEAQMRMLQDHNRQLDAQLKRIKGLISDAQGAAALTAAAEDDGGYYPVAHHAMQGPKLNGLAQSAAAARGMPYGQQQQVAADRHNYSAGYGDTNNNLLFASPLSPHSQTFNAGGVTGVGGSTLPYVGVGFGSQQQQGRGGSFRGNREDFPGVFQRGVQTQYSTPPRRRQQPPMQQQQRGDGSKASVGQLLNAVGDLNNKLGKLVTVMTDDEDGSGATSSYENHHQPRSHAGVGGGLRENNNYGRNLGSDKTKLPRT